MKITKIIRNNPMDGFFITGTDTEIGKTLVTTILALGLNKHGVNACPIKPVASGGVEDDNTLVSGDAKIYRKLAGIRQPASALSPFCYKHPASPHLAAGMEEKTIDPAAVRESLAQFSKNFDALLVEGIGGWLVPITYTYKVADLACDLRLPVLLVSANKLGTINHTLLTLESIRSKGLKPAGVIITHPEPVRDSQIAKNNIETIQQVGQAEILGNIPFLGKKVELAETPETLWPLVKETIQWQRILQILNIQ